jgi:hypothetical protein
MSTQKPNGPHGVLNATGAGAESDGPLWSCGTLRVNSEKRHMMRGYLNRRGIEDCERFCSDPSSPMDMLVRLVRYRHLRNDPLTAHLAANPALPMDSLLVLLRCNPVEVSENPAFRLRMATEPGFLLSLSRRNQCHLAGGPGVDARILRELAESRGCAKSVRRAAASNSQCPPEMLEGFLRHAWQVRVALTHNPALPPHLQHRLAEDPKREVRADLARHSEVELDVLDTLGKPDDHIHVQMAVALNLRCPDHVLARLQEHGHPQVRSFIARRQKSIGHLFDARIQYLEESLHREIEELFE